MYSVLEIPKPWQKFYMLMAINYFLSLEDIRRLDTYQTTNLKFRPQDAIANQDYFQGCICSKM